MRTENYTHRGYEIQITHNPPIWQAAIYASKPNMPAVDWTHEPISACFSTHPSYGVPHTAAQENPRRPLWFPTAVCLPRTSSRAPDEAFSRDRLASALG